MTTAEATYAMLLREGFSLTAVSARTTLDQAARFLRREAVARAVIGDAAAGALVRSEATRWRARMHTCPYCGGPASCTVDEDTSRATQSALL